MRYPQRCLTLGGSPVPLDQTAAAAEVPGRHSGTSLGPGARGLCSFDLRIDGRPRGSSSGG